MNTQTHTGLHSLQLQICNCTYYTYGGKCPGGKYPRGEMSGGKCRGEMSGGEMSGYQFPYERIGSMLSIQTTAPRSMLAFLGCLDRVLHSVARLIGGIPKFGHVSKYMLDVLRWLPAEQRISYRIASMV